MNIGGVEIGPNQPCRIVAELSNSHNGSLERAKRIIRECADAGADFVKFQCYTPDELVALRGDGPAPDPWGSDGWSMRDLYEKAQTPHAWFPELVAECEAVGVPWFSSVFGVESLILLEQLGCPAYKIAALDADTDFARLLGHGRGQIGPVPRGTKTIIASSRGARIPWADLTLHCPEGYPQKPGDIYDDSTYEGFDDGFDGLSYHGTDVPIASRGLTGYMLEVHVQLDDEPSELEANVSLTISQLRQLCKAR